MTVSRYIGRVHNDVTSDMVRDHVKGQGVDVVDMEKLTNKHSRFQSFRLQIKKVDLAKIQTPSFWPEGVAVKPFFRPKADGIHADGTRVDGIPAGRTHAGGTHAIGTRPEGTRIDGTHTDGSRVDETRVDGTHTGI